MIAQLHLGDLFHSRRERGRAGLPVISVTMDNGLVDRDLLDRKTNGALAPEEHLLVRKGDIAYNMMRMWQGASGLAENDGIVSPAYVVLAPKDRIDPLFASYWFKSARMIYLFWAYSYGMTGDRLRLYFKDFSQVPIAIPPKSEQERIGQLLASADQAAAAMEKLIAAQRRFKKGLAEQLLTGQHRLPGFGHPAIDGKVGKTTVCGRIPREWRCVRIGSLGNTYGGLTGKFADDFGKGQPYIPYLNIFENTSIDTCRLDYVRIKEGEKQNTVQYGDIFFTTSSETQFEVGMASVLLQDLSTTYLNSFCFGFRLHDFNSLLPEFAGHLLRASAVRRAIARLSQGATRYNLPQSCVKDLNIPLPPLNEQIRIAAVLSAADEECLLLGRKLAALRELKKGLMQKLF